MAKFKCPNVHKLTVANKIKAGSNIFVQYSCQCNDRYIFAPGLKKEKLQPKNRIYKTINLSYNISKLDDGYNQINDIIKYKFFGEKIKISIGSNEKKCISCVKDTKNFI